MFKQYYVVAVFFGVLNRSGTLSTTNPKRIVVTMNSGFRCEKRRLTPSAVAYSISIAGRLVFPLTSELIPALSGSPEKLDFPLSCAYAYVLIHMNNPVHWSPR
jgi:hypothetical protein